MLWAELLSFMGIMAVAQLSPGPDMVLLTRTTLHFGRSKGWAMAAGIACGLVVHALLALTGVTLLMKTSAPWVWQSIQAVAASYLFWLAWEILRGFFQKKTESTDDCESIDQVVNHGAAWRRGLLCNILNGKAAIAIAMMILPFAAKSESVLWTVALFCVLVFQAFALWVLWVVLLQRRKVPAFYLRSERVFDAVFGCVLLCLGIGLLFQMMV